jgi:choline dehydrogenase-like flavoprotein
VDWPIGYDDLAPFYDWVEWEIGVAGDAGDRNSGPRARGYPMPPLLPSLRTKVLARGARALDLATFTPPILVNTVPRAGRDACCHCGSCVGFPCPTDAKNGTQNTMIPRALATGRTTLISGAHVTIIEQDDNGHVIGVRYRTDAETGEHFARAKAVVVCAGAIETARLLLLSASSAHPEGLGNHSDQLGRHLQGHYYPTAYGLFDEEVHPSEGPGVSIATTDFTHGNEGIIGGAMIADDFVMLPTAFFHHALPPDLRRWGSAAKDFMRENFKRVAKMTGPVHEIPDPGCRVQLANLTDRFGQRVARLSGQVHVETIRTAEFIGLRSADWLAASGARQVWRPPIVRRLSAGQHQAGTCRMGADPASSVTDQYGRVWGHTNLFVCDGSLHPTNGAYNPVLTIMAMAARNAQIVSQAI